MGCCLREGCFFVLGEVLVGCALSCRPPVRCRGSWGSTSAVLSTLAACAAARPLPVFQFVCMIILIIRRSVVWTFFISSIIVHVPDAQRSDRVTVASKSLSLSLSGYFGDVNCCLWLVNVAHAHLKRCSKSPHVRNKTCDPCRSVPSTVLLEVFHGTTRVGRFWCVCANGSGWDKYFAEATRYPVVRIQHVVCSEFKGVAAHAIRVCTVDHVRGEQLICEQIILHTLKPELFVKTHNTPFPDLHTRFEEYVVRCDGQRKKFTCVQDCPTLGSHRRVARGAPLPFPFG